MQRPGMDPDNAKMEDFVCDFCLRTWAEDRPMVEGHRGSLICSACLSVAFDLLWNRLEGERSDGVCALCLEKREEKCWSPGVWPPVGKGVQAQMAAGKPMACKRCVKQSVVMLERDPDYGWKRPAAKTA